ncbi:MULTISPECIES: xanthine dehydrogenase family protein subunit M [Streptomyces]|uniref:Xanthine dehydrogenase family protein subunit M n=1 Tax=Streptomyces lycii TaxID=2654337 RepID=A0ABQ7FJB8_9ACTN|nr:MULTISPECIES: xanthine dehydrogenase family protein subunit M [Streptomyces]KAF4408708.1 xanthine dehydrogenase family protein subunit M [Streptomyces lycii]PGH46805.1 FAD-binding molybdopterin dehydrogenase [Streptomyces sp. Ru87]
MKDFDFRAAETTEDALAQAGADTAYLAGGTTLVDLMKLQVMTPRQVIDINALPLRSVRTGDDGLRIGALERMAAVAGHPQVREWYPVISQALLASASQQIRNMASMGGNLLQRTRCGYFRDVSAPCNKREPGSGCAAIDGVHRAHAVLGTSDSCVATHPSDLAVALVALDASVELRSTDGPRTVPLADFYREPGSTPERENELRPGELVTEIVVPALPWAARSTYLKIRDRSSYEFALSSAAVALDLKGDSVAGARIAVGGTGTKPWRLPAVEEALTGRPATRETYEQAAERATEGMRTLPGNRFKPTLVRRTLVRALLSLGD